MRESKGKFSKIVKKISIFEQIYSESPFNFQTGMDCFFYSFFYMVPTVGYLPPFSIDFDCRRSRCLQYMNLEMKWYTLFFKEDNTFDVLKERVCMKSLNFTSLFYLGSKKSHFVNFMSMQQHLHIVDGPLIRACIRQ